MDKIEAVIFRYKSERKMHRDFKVKMTFMVISMFLVLAVDLIFLLVAPSVYKMLATIVTLVIVNIMIKLYDGKLGTSKWKNKIKKMYRDKFILDQNILLKIISDEGLNNQQVYNLIVKKYERLPQGISKENYIITIISLIVAMTGVLASPFQNIDNYVMYIRNIIVILIYLLPLGYLMYRNIFIKTKQSDKKKAYYRYLIELLEDVLY